MILWGFGVLGFWGFVYHQLVVMIERVVVLFIIN